MLISVSRLCQPTVNVLLYGVDNLSFNDKKLISCRNLGDIKNQSVVGATYLLAYSHMAILVVACPS